MGRQKYEGNKLYEILVEKGPMFSDELAKIMPSSSVCNLYHHAKSFGIPIHRHRREGGNQSSLYYIEMDADKALAMVKERSPNKLYKDKVALTPCKHL